MRGVKREKMISMAITFYTRVKPKRQKESERAYFKQYVFKFIIDIFAISAIILGVIIAKLLSEIFGHFKL